MQPAVGVEARDGFYPQAELTNCDAWAMLLIRFHRAFCSVKNVARTFNIP
jgi:hypothetical protein